MNQNQMTDNQKTYIPYNEHQSEVQAARRDGISFALRQMFRAGKAGLLGYGAFMLLTKLSGNTKIGVVGALFAASTEYINLKPVLQKGISYARQANETLDDIQEARETSDNL